MYYPKSQIKPNIFTNGNELITSINNQPYSGYYYEISNGNQYTGKNPQDGPNLLLIPILVPFNPSEPPHQADISFEDGPIILSNIDSQYEPTSQFITRSIPLFNPTLPTPQDNQNGQFNRYFCKKNNETRYLEIDKNTYQQLQKRDPKIAWDLYTPIIVLWIIQGNQTQVFNSNKATVQAIETNAKWGGFSQYFQDKFLKYYLSSDINNLYTSGGEFTTKNGQNYIGFYHIHNGITPMVGKTHINTPHDILLPIKKSQPITQNTNRIMLPTSPNIPSEGGSSIGGGGSY
jgi:hypothetical protein